MCVVGGRVGVCKAGGREGGRGAAVENAKHNVLHERDPLSYLLPFEDDIQKTTDEGIHNHL